MTELVELMCSASDFRASTDFNIFKNAEATRVGTSDSIDLHVEERDEIRGVLVDIEIREREELNTLLETVGPRPLPEEEEGEEDGGGGGGGVSVAIESSVGGGASSSQAQGGQKKGDAAPSTKKKSQAKKDLPESVKQKLTNNAAMMAVGGNLKSWMLPGASLTTSTPVGSKSTGPASKSATGLTIPITSGSFLEVPKSEGQRKAIVRGGHRGVKIQKRITIKDALLVLESQRHLSRSELFYKWLANIK